MSEVSCRAIADLLAFAESKGISSDSLLLDLPFSKEYVQHPNNRVSWDGFCLVSERLEVLYGPHLPTDLVKQILESKYQITTYFMSLVSFISSLTQFYWVSSKWAGPMLFTNFTTHYKKLSKHKIQIENIIPARDKDSPFFLKVAGAMYERFPSLYGLGNAIVETKIEERKAIHIIILPPSESPWNRVKRAVKLRVAPRKTIAELLDHQRDMQVSYDETIKERVALDAVKKDLECRVWESKEHIRSIFDTMHALVYLVSNEKRYLAINPFVKEYGLNPEEIIGRTAFDIMPHETAQKFDVLFQQVLETGDNIFQVTNVETPRGAEWHEVSLSPVFDQSGRVIAISGVSTDVTALKTAEVRLRAAKDSADKANEAKSQFLANMSHELRTPMSSVLGFADLLREGKLSDEKREYYISKIESNGNSLMAIIDDLLEISRIEAGHLDLDCNYIGISKFLDTLIGNLSDKTKQKGLSITAKVGADLPEGIYADPNRLGQVLSNLIGNAIKFTDHGNIIVTAYRSKEDHGEFLNFDVQDSGCGIHFEFHDMLFQPFSQEKSPRTRTRGGTGLGLMLSRKLARAMKGEVSLKNSAPGIGSTFSLVLPIVEKEQAAATVKSSAVSLAASEAAPSLSSLKGLKILLIEDNQDLLQLYKTILSNAGSDIDTAGNGKDGLQKMLENKYNVVFMDIQLPDINGLEVVRRARDAGIKTPLLALSAFARREEKDNSIKAGCNDHISKPVSARDLCDKALKWATEPGLPRQ